MIQCACSVSVTHGDASRDQLVTCDLLDILLDRPLLVVDVQPIDLAARIGAAYVDVKARCQVGCLRD